MIRFIEVQKSLLLSRMRFEKVLLDSSEKERGSLGMNHKTDVSRTLKET